MEPLCERGYYPLSPAEALPQASVAERPIALPPEEGRVIWLSTLKEELLRARKLEAAGKERLDDQEKLVAQLKAKDIHHPQSERLLEIMRETHRLHASHVRLLESEVREFG
jgi:hypothetical protein